MLFVDALLLVPVCVSVGLAPVSRTLVRPSVRQLYSYPVCMCVSVTDGVEIRNCLVLGVPSVRPSVH